MFLPGLWIARTGDDIIPVDWASPGGAWPWSEPKSGATGGGNGAGGGDESTCTFGSDSWFGFGFGFGVWVWALALSSAKASQNALCVIKLSLLQKTTKTTQLQNPNKPTKSHINI